MNLKDLDNKNHAQQALKENFELSFDVSKLSAVKAKDMLRSVTAIIKESRQADDFYKKQNGPAFMKLLFIEQALKDRCNKSTTAKIVVENQQVEKSQVILAAQDMVDTIQKTYEDVNDMLVKELPALVSSIQSEIGVNESNEFNTKVSTTLQTLNSSLQQARNDLQSALGIVTGESTEPFSPESDDLDLDLDLGDEPESDELDLDLDLDLGDDMDDELDDLDDMSGGVGRERR